VTLSRAAAVGWALALLAAPASLRAQERPQTVDRVVAVVGDRPILLSEVEEQLLVYQSGGQQLPTDSAARQALRRQALEQMIDEEVLYQRARQDTTIVVTDADVQGAVENQVRQVRAQFASDAEFRGQIAAAGFGTVEEYRRWLADQQRRAAYQQRYLDKLRQEGRLRGSAVSEADVRRAFAQEQARARNQMRPATVTFRQIVVAPRPTPLALAAARARADSALAELNGGADFATVARRLSDDLVTRERGGDLGWFRRGSGMAQAFERVAFRLRPGQTSEVFYTPFGFHIVLVERVQPGEVKARHILFSPAVTGRELAAAQLIADTVAARIRAGGDFDSLYALFADTAEAKAVGPIPRTQLTERFGVYAAALEGVDSGRVSPVFAINAEDTLRTKYAVAVVDDIQPERPYNFEDVRDQLRVNVQNERAIADFIGTLRRQTYVDIRL